MLAAAAKGKLPDELRKQIEPPGKPDKSPAVQAAAEGWRQFNRGQAPLGPAHFPPRVVQGSAKRCAAQCLCFLPVRSGKAAVAKQYFEKCLKLTRMPPIQ